MNSINFINKKIKETERGIICYEELLKKYPKDNALIKCLNFREKELQAFQQIKFELDVLLILTKCIRVSTISYDDSDVSKTFYDYSLETDELTIKEFNTLDNYYKALEVEDK